MKRENKLTLEEHKKIAEWLTDPIARQIACDIPNAYGKSSYAGKMASKLADIIVRMKSEMENKAYADGYPESATDLYYPPASKRLSPTATNDL